MGLENMTVKVVNLTYQHKVRHQSTIASCRNAHGLASYTDGAPVAETQLQRSIAAHQRKLGGQGRLNALCICAYLCLQLGQAASALKQALDLLTVSGLQSDSLPLHL